MSYLYFGGIMATKSSAKTIDIHGLTADDARKRLEREIRTAPPTLKKIVVIHGCNNGTVLRDMVRTRLRSMRIEMIVPTFSNDGETTIFLK